MRSSAPRAKHLRRELGPEPDAVDDDADEEEQEPFLTRRRLALVLGLMAAALVVTGVSYVRGGNRLSGGSGAVSAAVSIGEELHALVPLDTGGASLELVSASTVGVSAGLQADVQLVRVKGEPPSGTSRGELDTGYEIVDLHGHLLQTLDSADRHYVLDVTVVARTAGVHSMEGVEITYRDGFLRKRTATIAVPLCVEASDDWREAPDVSCEPPE